MPPIPGEAGVDFPVLTAVPDTGFDCNAQQFLPGIYGDTGAECQVDKKYFSGVKQQQFFVHKRVKEREREKEVFYHSVCKPLIFE